MKSASCLTFLCFFSFLLIAQKRGELLFSIDTTSADSIKIGLFQELANSYRGVNYDSAYFFGRKGLDLARKANDRKGLASMQNVLGTLHFYQSNYDSAIFYYSNAYRYALNQNDSLRMGALLNNIGTLFSYKSEYDTSLFLLFNAREIRDKIKDPKIASTINNIGLAYNKLGQFEEALKYYKKAAELKEKIGATLSLSNSYNNIGIILKNLQKYDSAIIYYQKSLAIAEQFRDKNKQANAHNNLGILYNKIDLEVNLSEFHFKEAIRLKNEIDDKIGLFNSYNNYAGLLSKQKRYSEALNNIEKAELIEKVIGKNMHSFKGLLTKSEVLSALGRFKEAILLKDSAWSLRLEEINVEKNKKIVELEVAYETEKKEAKIIRLSLENDLKDSRILAVAVGGGLAVILLIVFFTLRSKKLKVEAEAQELQIEALKKRFMDLHSTTIDLGSNMNFEELNEKFHTPLTEREFDSLKLSVQGKTNTEIAEELFITNSTVKFHLRNTYAKMGVANRKEAFQYVAKTS